MTRIIGFDVDVDATHVAALAYERGARWVGRYLKNTSIAEISALRAAGLAVLPIWETAAERALTGTAGGAADGQAAARMMRQLGFPDGSACAMTADFDPERQQIETVHDYMIAGFSALAAGKYGMLAYGAFASVPSNVFAWCPDNKWTGNQDAITAGKVAIIQDVGDKRGLNLGIDIDSDLATVPLETLGMWMPAAAGASPHPAATSTPPAGSAPAQQVIPVCRDLQAALVKAGYQIDVDGIFGNQTTGALADYYRRR